MLTFIAATKPVLIQSSAAEPYLWALFASALLGVLGGFIAVWFIMRGSFTNMVSFFAKDKDVSIQELESLLEEIKKAKKEKK